mgnify:CR=1 FL=1
MDERLDKVKVQCDYLPLINFAIQQNGASVIHQLSIENTTSAPLKDGRERDAAFAPGLFAEALEVQVLEVGPDEAACREGIEELFGEADAGIELGQRRAVEAQAIMGNEERGRSQQLQPLLDVARSEGIGPAAGILLGTDAVDLAA